MSENNKVFINPDKLANIIDKALKPIEKDVNTAFEKVNEKFIELDTKIDNIDGEIKNIDGKIENKVNAMLLKHLGIKWQSLSIILIAFGIQLGLVYFVIDKNIKPLYTLMEMQYKNQGKFIEPAKKLESDRASLKLKASPEVAKEPKKAASL